MEIKDPNLLEDFDESGEVDEILAGQQTMMIVLPVSREFAEPFLDAVAQTMGQHEEQTSPALRFVLANLRFDLESARRGALPPHGHWQ